LDVHACGLGEEVIEVPLLGPMPVATGRWLLPMLAIAEGLKCSFVYTSHLGEEAWWQGRRTCVVV
jgi:hypothetical protein